eukprot:2513059-Alexandrium_andersonii.AAC.1
MVQLCRNAEYKIASSYKKRDADKVVTYRSPGTNRLPCRREASGEFGELDHVLVAKRWAGTLNAC